MRSMIYSNISYFKNNRGMTSGVWHRVKVKRYHRDVQLTVDRELVVIGRFCANIKKTKI